MAGGGASAGGEMAQHAQGAGCSMANLHSLELKHVRDLAFVEGYAEPVLAILFISPALGVKVGVGSRLPGNALTRIGWGDGREAVCVGVGILSEGVGLSMIFTGVGIFGAFGDTVGCNRVSNEATEAF